MTDLPFISVIIVNFNGWRFLPACLEALNQQTYPRECFEVVVSDNGSTDGSVEKIKQQYPWVKVLNNGKNLGFAAGNNFAIQASPGEAVVLLNNDTSPAPDWLENLVGIAFSEPKIGIVTGKLQLFYDQLPLSLSSGVFSLDSDSRQLGVQVFGVDPGVELGVVQYLEGFYGWEPHPMGRKFRWTQGEAKLGLPVPLGDEGWQVILELAVQRKNGEPVTVKWSLPGGLSGKWVVESEEPAIYSIKIPAEARRYSTPLIQNAGSIIFADGTGRDRGTYVRGTELFFEVDRNQYGEVEEVFSGCGASLLLKKEMLADVGAFDDDFFMYYEDTDLAWRARMRGWKVVYAPNAAVRHIHCGSSKEWSPFFAYHVYRNHLAMVYKNGTAAQILWTWGRFIRRLLKHLVVALVMLIERKGWRPTASEAKLELRVMATLVKWLPSLSRKRYRIQSNRVVSSSALKNWFVQVGGE